MSILKVAQLAGVSTSTVSRVINDHPRVAAATADTVRRAMKQLSFAPSARRPGPKPGSGNGLRTATIAFLVFGTSGSQTAPAFESLLRGVSAASVDQGLNMIFSFVSDPTELPPRIVERGVDGLLLHGERPGPAVIQKLQALPTVWLMANRLRPTWGDQVMPDNTVVGQLAAQYLARRGHRDLAYLWVGSPSWSLRVRAMAFEQFAQELGARVTLLESIGRGASSNGNGNGADHAATDYWRDDNLATSVGALVDQLVSTTPRPTGLFVAEDRLTPHVDAALARRGLRVGDDLDLISCNNERPHLLGLRSVPAEIDIRVESIGRRGVEQLLWRMRNPSRSERICAMIEPCLIEPEPAKQLF